MNGRRQPFGYKRTEEGLEAIEEELVALDEVGKMVKDGALSLRAGAEELFLRTGRKISHGGLKQRIYKEEKKKQNSLITKP